ncbi:hypothetical protein NMY22_g10270 [Coprinellus aureogranulatus]|nr:hypothetical protein NMY22_g10270 [Coprinellus aureogranulatus]
MRAIPHATSSSIVSQIGTASHAEIQRFQNARDHSPTKGKRESLATGGEREDHWKHEKVGITSTEARRRSMRNAARANRNWDSFGVDANGEPERRDAYEEEKGTGGVD